MEHAEKVWSDADLASNDDLFLHVTAFPIANKTESCEENANIVECVLYNRVCIGKLIQNKR